MLCVQNCAMKISFVFQNFVMVQCINILVIMKLHLNNEVLRTKIEFVRYIHNPIRFIISKTKKIRTRFLISQMIRIYRV